MSKKSAKPSRRKSANSIKRILAIDVGGTGLKAAIVGRSGEFLSERLRLKTPRKRGPRQIVAALMELVEPLKDYDRVSIGFPGYVRGGVVVTAPNLGTRAWAGFKLAAALEKKLGAPTRLTNDADVQGLGVIKGKGLELVCTLGTGFGTAWFEDGRLLPHLEIAHMPIRKHRDLDDYVGERTLGKIGHKAWSKRVRSLVTILATVFNYDRLYIGGGNARLIKFRLPRNVTRVSNDAGVKGNAEVWVPRI